MGNGQDRSRYFGLLSEGRIQYVGEHRSSLDSKFGPKKDPLIKSTSSHRKGMSSVN